MGEVREDVVLLHGFAGSRRTWDAVLEELAGDRLRPRALDLPGHGADADDTRPISFAACVERVLAEAPDRFVLCGYSLGGRVALHLALAVPARVRRLVLVSSTPGIADRSERARRRARDRRLAVEIERSSIEDFIERWSAQPIFAADSPQVQALARADYGHGRPAALARVLRGIGTGEMEPLWERLGELELPVTIVVGERDEKFRAIAGRMMELLPDAELVVVPGGHRLPLERPAAIARVL
jgi:2-succinyl-6-hydroxy-2,4-cyclohexadiene-1-carboxylate synthase